MVSILLQLVAGWTPKCARLTGLKDEQDSRIFGCDEDYRNVVCVFSVYHKDEQDCRIFGCDEDYRNVLRVCFQRIIKMNKILGYLDVIRIVVMCCVCVFSAYH